MSDVYWLTDEQMARLRPYFPKSHGKPRVDDRRVLSGIVFVNRNGLRWRDAPSDYGPHKACPEQLCSGTAILGVVFDHGVERDEELSHGGDDRELERFAGFTQPAGCRSEVSFA